MNRIITSLLCLLIGVLTAEAQEIADEKITDKNIIFLEAGGKAIIYSINYERIVHQFGTHRISIKGGFGYFPRITKKEINENGRRVSAILGALYFPLGISWIKEICGSGNHFLEIGLTETFEIVPGYEILGFKKNLTTRWITVPSIGYRYQNHKGLFYSFAYTPAIEKGILPVWIGVSIGKSF